MRHLPPAGQVFVLCAVAAIFPALGGETTWPTLHKDYQRSGYTDETLKGPFERKWFRDFHDEMIATRCEGIVAEGKVYVGTFAGNLHALKVEDGATAWTFKAAGPIGHSPCYHEGRLYVGSEGSFNQGLLYCVNAADGKEVWRCEVGGGVWVSPACDGAKVYFGDRAGVFHAVSAKEGKEVWSVATGGPILTPASFSPDQQKIVFGSEDLRVYCVDSAGKTLWTSRKLHGLSLRDHAPTIWMYCPLFPWTGD
jgi:outer membrane protein assembly factor BamB